MYVLGKERASPQITNRSILLDPEKSKDISRYYSVENELNFLERYGARLKPEEQFFYLVENQLRFLGEFVGHLKFSKIRYLLNEKNGFSFAGLRMIDMLNYTTDLVDQGREVYENLGIAQIYKAFEEDYLAGRHELKRAAVLSPPKDWDYAYMFYYDKKYDSFLGNFFVELYPLMYEEKRHQLVNSQKILLNLNPKNINAYKTTEDYLTKPFIETAPTLEQAIHLTGISGADIKRSDEFQQRMEQFLGKEIALYAQGVIELYSKQQSLSQETYQEKFDFLELLRRSIFNKARDVWENGAVTAYQSQNVPMGLDMAAILFYGQQKPATVAGGSCPVSNQSSNLSFANEILKGHSLEHILSSSTLSSENDPKKDPNLCPCGEPSEPHFHCPGENRTCGHPIIVGEGTSRCPTCGLAATCP